ncbi:type II toxin-antitoxin system Phd/YefM family antitoxin [Glycomyces tenuis]|uniref:type II toxin-antitoxin system Phd/YefM family antitoxin n=2 Tax=Glycomyces tenuis TaxID=58116 RepID=UPI0012DCA62A|nr:type II toxin-antitoxin system prevent-host-death family antitoxin [Glycomyces tenuis]
MIDVMTEEHVTIRELQRNAAEIFKRVQEGHTVLVTRWGEVVGQITPPDPANIAIDRAIAAGLLDPAVLDRLPTGPEARNIVREPSPPGTNRGSEAIDRLREEREF